MINKETLLTGWNFSRWIRLALGVTISIQAYQMHDMLSGLFGAFFLFQAVTNTGCCSMNSCAMVPKKEQEKDIKDVIFEEIKSK